MRGAPHSGLSRLIVRIKSRMSAGTAGWPTRRRDLQRQYRREPLRCQRTSVSGLKTTAASSKEGYRVELVTLKVVGHGVPDVPRAALAAQAALPKGIVIAEPLRQAYFGPARGWCDTAIINRSDLREPRAGQDPASSRNTIRPASCRLGPPRTSTRSENIVIDVGATPQNLARLCRGNRIARKRGRGRLARWLKSRLSSRAKHTPVARGSAQLAQ